MEIGQLALVSRPVILQSVFIAVLALSPLGTSAGSNSAAAITATEYTGPDPAIPVDILRLQVKHLSADELITEADLWQDHLQQVVQKLNAVNVEIWYENQKLAEAEAVSDDQPEKIRAEAIVEVETEKALKEEKLELLAELRDQRIQVIDRFNVVLDSLSAKLGQTPEGNEQDAVLQYRRYVDSVKSVQVDVADSQATRATIFSWLKSPEGGLRLAKDLGEFISILAGFWLLSIALSKLAGKALSLSSTTSQILRKFVVDSVRRITLIVGILLGLVALEVNITPLVAIIGAAGFVIAFALQNTLSNFASGLMIMLYKPFDIGDVVETSNFAGKVRSMTLVTTNVMTVDNKLMVVPNNELWGKTITNVTGSDLRRVDLVFGIGYGDDMGLAEKTLRDITDSHPKILEEPETIIRVSELADSSVNLVCRPWVRTEDYWEVYWDVTRSVKERFDAQGISIPFPQQDIHLHSPPANQKQQD